MTDSVRAVFLGEDYQHRYFWIEACRLFIESPVVRRVSLELPVIKAFDDVVTTYSVPRYDAHGRQVDADHYQLKFHVDFAREITGLDLISPGFINAKKYSLLDRLAAATKARAIPKRLSLVTSWRVNSTDPLRYLVSGADGEMIIDRIFEGGPASEMGKLREAWRQHLGGIDDQLLRRVLVHLKISDGVTLSNLKERLQDKLGSAGLELADEARLDDTYLGISRAFIKNRTREHDAVSLRPGKLPLTRRAVWKWAPTKASYRA